MLRQHHKKVLYNGHNWSRFVDESLDASLNRPLRKRLNTDIGRDKDLFAFAIGSMRPLSAFSIFLCKKQFDLDISQTNQWLRIYFMETFLRKFIYIR